MIAMKISKFAEAKSENLKSFLQFVEFEFISYKENFSTKNAQRKEKTLLIRSNCIEETKLHINDLKSTIRNDYELLKASLRERFLEAKKKNRRKETMNALYEFKQRDRRIQKYFKKTRYLKRSLIKLNSNIAKRMIKELDDQTIRKIVKFTLASNNKSSFTIEKVIKVIQNAEEKNDVIDDIISTILNNANTNVTSFERVFMKFMKQQQTASQKAQKQNANVIRDIVASFSALSLNTSQSAFNRSDSMYKNND